MELIHTLTEMVCAEGMTSMESLCSLLIFLISVEFAGTLLYAIFRGLR